MSGKYANVCIRRYTSCSGNLQRRIDAIRIVAEGQLPWLDARPLQRRLDSILLALRHAAIRRAQHSTLVGQACGKAIWTLYSIVSMINSVLLTGC